MRTHPRHRKSRPSGIEAACLSVFPGAFHVGQIHRSIRRRTLRLNSLPRFFRFALVGCAGYGVDVAALYFAIYGLGAGLYWGRVFSYLCASSSTWYMNRLITFADLRSDKFRSEDPCAGQE